MPVEIRKVQVAEGVTVSEPAELAVTQGQTSTGNITYDGVNSFAAGPFTIAPTHTYTLINGAFWTIVEKLVGGTLIVTNGTVKVLA